ncbi:unnamed protein product [Moneuplotes crassus]|uniref:Maf-like protein n=2 Tax=Euplotes crassus TaxID=5936 RepID=A0AAD1XXA8_EUPCR|nr:unnamed protein product [Moneuplotes crassus]
MLSPYLEQLNSKKIILASGSAARKQILEQAGLRFTVSPSSFAEDLDKSQFTHEEYVKSTAEGKLIDKIEEIKQKEEKVDIIIVGDTVISFGDKIIEKAEDEEHAFSIIKELQGETHDCLSAVVIAFLDSEMEIIKQETFVQKTTLEFYPLSDEVIKLYIATGEAFGKAGCYGIQSTAATWIKKINGCYFSVWGFPLSLFCVSLIKMIEETGFLDE